MSILPGVETAGDVKWFLLQLMTMIMTINADDDDDNDKMGNDDDDDGKKQWWR